MMDRRRILGAGAATGFLGMGGVSAQTESRPGALKVTVTFNGQTYGYPDGPKIPSYYVDFCEDGRVVFHHGALGNLTGKIASAEPYRLGPHQVRIESGGKVLLQTDLAAHWWNAEWTYRLAPLAVKRTPQQIVAANRMFAFGDTGARVPPPINHVFRGPMDSAGITLYMPTTGERGDIGLITDVSAYFMLGQDAGPMLAWAQAGGSCPMHYRDEATGKPISLLKYPEANAYDEPGLQGNPWLHKGPVNAAGNSAFDGGWAPQQAHYCEMSYVAYLATLDGSFLRDLQYSANFTVLCDGQASQARKIATVHGEERGLGWALRNLFMAHAATQDAEAAGTLPASCMPASYFKTLLDNQLPYFSKVMNDPAQRVMHVFAGIRRSSPWMGDYNLMALALGVLTGHADWTPLYLWSLKYAIDRTSGTSGFPPGYGTPYRLNVSDASGRPYASYGEAFKGLLSDNEEQLTQAKYDAMMADPLNGGRALWRNEYMMTTRAVLVMADYLEKRGLAKVRAMYPELDTCLTNADRMVRAFGKMNARVSVVG